MKSIDFPGATLKIGANQTDIYSVIHALPVDDGRGEIIACFELSDEELAEVTRTKKIFYSRLTFGHPFQPMRIFTALEDGAELLIPEEFKAKQETWDVECPICSTSNKNHYKFCIECGNSMNQGERYK